MPRCLCLIAVKALALEEMHSRIKLMIATAVGRRGKWRTLWRVGQLEESVILVTEEDGTHQER